MPREQLEHVIEKSDARFQIGSAIAIEIQSDGNFGLASLSREVGRAISFIGILFHQNILGDGGRLQGLDAGKESVVFIGGAHGYADLIG